MWQRFFREIKSSRAKKIALLSFFAGALMLNYYLWQGIGDYRQSYKYFLATLALLIIIPPLFARKILNFLDDFLKKALQ